MTEARRPPTTVTYRAGKDTRMLRDAFACFATGVTILTTNAEDDSPVGLTVSSFSSVSLDPPLLLVCPALDAGSTAVLKTAERFAVNVLASGDKALSTRFARKGEDRFAEGEWHRSADGLPLLDRALATFECERHAVHEGGDHLIVVGRIQRAVCHPHDDPLLYYRSRYRGIHIED